MFSFIGLDVSDTPVGLTWPLGAASLVLLDSSFSDVEVAVSEGVPGNGNPARLSLNPLRPSLS